LLLRGTLFVSVLGAAFFDGLSWAVLPGRFLLGLLGAHGPDAGRYAVVLSGVVYAAAALMAAVARREADAEAALEPAGLSLR
jgi:hypothetical protein